MMGCLPANNPGLGSSAASHSVHFAVIAEFDSWTGSKQPRAVICPSVADNHFAAVAVLYLGGAYVTYPPLCDRWIRQI